MIDRSLSRGLIGALACLLLFVAPVGAGGLQFAVPIAQGVITYQEPGVGKQFSLEILHPYEVVATRSLSGVKWLQIKDPGGGAPGWVDAALMEYWNARHALRPKRSSRNALLGYCSRDDVERAVRDGRFRPCVKLDPELLQGITGSRAPFPVLRVEQMFDSDGLPTVVMEALVPTTYSNVLGVVEGGAAVAQTLEVIILIDGTASMDDEIAGTALALQRMVSQAEKKLTELHLKFVVIAYRDTNGTLLPDGTRCAAMEASSGSQLVFHGADQARRFLEDLPARCGGDDNEAIWDAMYLLGALPTQAGAARALVLVGDAPSHATTVGGTFLGTRVPAGLDRSEVFRKIAGTLGQSTMFLPTVVDRPNSLNETVEQMFHGIQFNAPALDLITVQRGQRNRSESERRAFSANLADQLYEKLSAAVHDAHAAGKRMEKCREMLGRSFGSAVIAPFCMENSSKAADRMLAARIRDLLASDDDDLMIVRKVWVKWDQTAVGDVVLLGKDEATRLRKVLLALQARTSTGDCKTAGAQAWYEIMGALVPIQPETGNMPSLDEAWLDYLQVNMNVAKGQTLLHRSPSELASLSSSACTELSGDLGQAAQGLSRLLDRYQDSAHLWVPLSLLP